jgi:RNA polymerase sigma-70 factor (ECF subfamily)
LRTEQAREGNVDEREAVEQLKRGDIAGLETLVETHQLRALRAAQLITRDPALAEDVVQSAFLQAYERIGQFDASRPFGPWFLRSVVNAALQATARQRRMTVLADGIDGLMMFASVVLGPEAHAEKAEQEQVVRAALDRLSAHQRAAIVLRYYLGFSEAEMAATLAAPVGTIKRRLHDARLQLRALLTGVFNPATSADRTK